MKTAQIIGRILAWINLICWSILLIGPLLSSFAALDLKYIVSMVLFASIPLQSYAALQLQKSIRHPEIKLSQQTPVGIRFVGLVALFVGFLVILSGVAVMAPEVAQRMLPQLKDQMAGLRQGDTSMITPGFVQGVGGFLLCMGLMAIVSVLIHLRLLRWYFLVKQSDVS
jgi:hypothetical protein